MCFHFRGSVPGAGRLGRMRVSVSFHETAGQVPGRPFSPAGRWLPPRASSPAPAFVRALQRDRPYLAVRSACTVVSTDDFSIFSCAGCHPYFFFEDVPAHIFCSFRKNCVPGGRGEFFTFRVQMVRRRCGRHTFSPGLLLVFSFS